MVPQFGALAGQTSVRQSSEPSALHAVFSLGAAQATHPAVFGKLW
jgi:hypothetical protein